MGQASRLSYAGMGQASRLSCAGGYTERWMTRHRQFVRVRMVATREISEFMASPTPLHGLELIDCAKANAMQGIETAAQLCGYGEDLKAFERELQEAGHRIGVKISELSDLITDQQTVRQAGGIEIAPDTQSEL